MSGVSGISRIAGLAAGLALSLGLAVGAPAAAGTLPIDSIHFFNNSLLRWGTATPSDGSGDFTFVLTPFVITSPLLAGDTLAFCLDFDLDLPLGRLTVPYADFDFDLGDPEAVGRVGQLVNYGTSIYSQPHGPGGFSEDTIYELSVVQAAIWRITNPDFTIVFAADNHEDQPDLVPELNARIAAYAAEGKAGYSTEMRTLWNPDYQPLAIAVPEPGTWGLTIGGFAGLGVALRRRREPLRSPDASPRTRVVTRVTSS